jgi:hypothetical protein
MLHSGTGASPTKIAAPDNCTTPSSKKKFTNEEDNYLAYLVSVHGNRNWKTVAWYMHGRTVRQCRERFKYYLEPGIERPKWTAGDDQLLMDRYAEVGPKWAQLASFFAGRTDIDVKNRYHRLRRSLRQQEKEKDAAQEIEKINGIGDGNSPKPRFPSLAPEVDWLGVVARPAMSGPVRPRRIICARPGGEGVSKTRD